MSFDTHLLYVGSTVAIVICIIYILVIAYYHTNTRNYLYIVNSLISCYLLKYCYLGARSVIFICAHYLLPLSNSLYFFSFRFLTLLEVKVGVEEGVGGWRWM